MEIANRSMPRVPLFSRELVVVERSRCLADASGRSVSPSISSQTWVRAQRPDDTQLLGSDW